MAITVLGTAGTTDAIGGHKRWSRGFVPFLVETPIAFRVKPVVALQRTVEVSPGSAQVRGVLVSSSAPEVVTVAANASNEDRVDVVAIRVTWARSGTPDGVEFVVKQGRDRAPSLERSDTVYEAAIAVVTVKPRAAVISARDIANVAPYGGGAGAIHIPHTDPLGVVDGWPNTELVTEGNRWRWRKREGWVRLDADSQPWRTWTPTLRSDAGPVNLGNGGTMKGRYKLIRGIVYAEFEVRSGVSQYHFGTGPIWVDLPVARDGDGAKDVWGWGHLYTTGEAPMDWHCQIGIARNASRGAIFVPTNAADVRQKHYQAADGSGRSGTGWPWIRTARSDGEVITGSLRYKAR